MTPNELINIKITYSPDRELKYSYAIEELLEKNSVIADKGKSSDFKRLQRVIKKYPAIPEFKFFLTHWYLSKDEDEKAFKWNQGAVKRHPNFLIAKLYLASQYLDRSQPEKALELFNEAFDLKKNFPELKEIHLSEAKLFLNIVCRYYTQIGDFDLAEVYLERLVDLDPDSPLTENCNNLLIMERILQRKEEEESAHSVQTIPPPQTTKTTPPIFTHEEIEILYLTDELDKDDLNYLYALPRESLIKDLEMVVRDGLERYSYFLDDNEIEEENTYFVLHAMMMLAELKATESYPVILEFLAQNDDFLQFYFGYFVTEHIWQVHFDLGQGQIDRMLEFMKKPKLFTYCKTEISVALIQMLIDDKISREQAIAFYEEILNFFLNATLENEVVDATLIGLLISDMMDVKMVELMDLMQALYEKNYVDTSLNGPWQEVVNELDTDTSTMEAWERERFLAYALE